MDVQTTTGKPGDHPVRDGHWISRAADGDAMITVHGVGLVQGRPVVVTYGSGRLKVSQDGVVVVDSELDETGTGFLSGAPSVFVQEVYEGGTVDEDGFVHHDSVQMVRQGA